MVVLVVLVARIEPERKHQWHLQEPLRVVVQHLRLLGLCFVACAPVLPSPPSGVPLLWCPSAPCAVIRICLLSPWAVRRQPQQHLMCFVSLVLFITFDKSLGRMPPQCDAHAALQMRRVPLRCGELGLQRYHP